jgi:hypothetical protein
MRKALPILLMLSFVLVLAVGTEAANVKPLIHQGPHKLINPHAIPGKVISPMTLRALHRVGRLQSVHTPVVPLGRKKPINIPLQEQKKPVNPR